MSTVLIVVIVIVVLAIVVALIASASRRKREQRLGRVQNQAMQDDVSHHREHAEKPACFPDQVFNGISTIRHTVNIVDNRGPCQHY